MNICQTIGASFFLFFFFLLNFLKSEWKRFRLKGFYFSVTLNWTLNLKFIAALGRSVSTPGLVESTGRVPLEKMELAAFNIFNLQSNTNNENRVVNNRWVVLDISIFAFYSNFLYIFNCVSNYLSSRDGSSSSNQESRCSFRSQPSSALLPMMPPFLLDSTTNEHALLSGDVSTIIPQSIS